MINHYIRVCTKCGNTDVNKMRVNFVEEDLTPEKRTGNGLIVQHSKVIPEHLTITCYCGYNWKSTTLEQDLLANPPEKQD